MLVNLSQMLSKRAMVFFDAFYCVTNTVFNGFLLFCRFPRASQKGTQNNNGKAI